MSKASELREMSDEQLELTAKEVAEKLFRLRFQAAAERLDVPSEIRKSRRQIARILTIQSQRRGAAARRLDRQDARDLAATFAILARYVQPFGRGLETTTAQLFGPRFGGQLKLLDAHFAKFRCFAHGRH